MITLPVSMAKAKESGNPFFIELYILQLRDGVMRIAATDENILYNNEEYTAVPFQRGEVTTSMDNLTDSCEVSLGDCSYELLKYVIEGFDFRGCNALIFRIQYPDSLKDPSIVQPVFSGYIDEPSYTNGEFSCKVKSRIPEIECPNRNFLMACNSEFGDEECGMSLAEETLTVQSVASNIVTLDKSHDKNYWKDGVISVGGESRIITESNENIITLNVNFVQDITGHSATLRRGCNKTVEACRAFGNMKHYSGFPAIPFESNYH